MKRTYKYPLTLDEKYAIVTQLLKQEVGYKRATDLIDAAFDAFDPVELAVLEATKELEKR